MAKSLYALAENPATFELLLAFDNDDTSTLNTWAETVASEGINWRAIVVPRVGYSGMHQYLNVLTEIARGEWLFILGDDAFVKTQGWDARILANTCDHILNTSNTSDPAYSAHALMHPVVPRLWAVAMGRLSPYQQSDTYLTMLGVHTGRMDLSWAVDICHVEDGATPSQRIQDDVNAEIVYSNNIPMHELARDAEIIRGLYS